MQHDKETMRSGGALAGRPLFPPLEPYRSGRLPVGGGHTLYWEECGNPRGLPVVFLHGGPGAGASPTHRRFFDPQAWRIVIFDQRGAGRSTPTAETHENTPDHLVADIEKLRQHLEIERWHVFGGSWGSTLALLYAQAHRPRVLGLMLRGIFLMTRREIDWFLHSMRMIFPEAWSRLAAHIPAAEHGDMLEAFYTRLMNPDPAVHMPAARLWSRYEAICSTLLPSLELTAPGDDRMSLSLARLETHYFRNCLFTPEDRLVRDVDIIRDVPAVIVQGRYDIVCPIASADALHRAWPEADYIVVPDAGHSALEPGICRELVQATERFRRITD
ncbi:prolyl aminopeptidase [Radicibacter daui]|uniref:prolyl aminopeptidase n=1 Tax=Radicibacter daui TaxID=3064829 RepID=UPI004046FC73